MTGFRWIGLAISALFSSLIPHTAQPQLDRTGVQHLLTALVERADRATMSGDRQALKAVFSPGSAAANVYYDKALQRLVYLSDWSTARKIHFDQVSVTVRIQSMRRLSPTEIRVSGAESARYQYHHTVGNTAESWFGLGVYHRYVIDEIGGSWYIRRDVFIDPLNQDTRLKGPAIPAVIQIPPEKRVEHPPSPGAKNALAFAARYCGAAPGCGNDNRYHPAFPDFNWNGGDCSNFISQVLKAGGFSETPQWNSRGEGSAAWVNAIRLSQYLQASGRATLYASGNLTQVLTPDRSGRSPLDRLRPGDLIAYYESGRVVHFAILAGFDPAGYPLVISHSADRFREPWDLGWDRTTRFLLFHVHYPAPAETKKDQAMPISTNPPVTASCGGVN